MSAKGKQKKKAKLRFAEYYDLQDTLDKLYTDSQNGKLFQNLFAYINHAKSADILAIYISLSNNKS